jgi:hypothetical protein
LATALVAVAAASFFTWDAEEGFPPKGFFAMRIAFRQ